MGQPTRVPASRSQSGRMVHGTHVTAVTRRCPCRACAGYRERPGGFSRDPDFIDDTAVERVASGDGYQELLTIAERQAVVRLLHAEGLNDFQMARRTGMCSRTVGAIRKHLGLPNLFVP